MNTNKPIHGRASEPMHIFIHKGGEQLGPFAFEEVLAKEQRGEITGEDKAWSPGRGQWTSLASLKADLATAQVALARTRKVWAWVAGCILAISVVAAVSNSKEHANSTSDRTTRDAPPTTTPEPTPGPSKLTSRPSKRDSALCRDYGRLHPELVERYFEGMKNLGYRLTKDDAEYAVGWLAIESISGAFRKLPLDDKEKELFRDEVDRFLASGMTPVLYELKTMMASPRDPNDTAGEDADFRAR